MRQEEVSVVQQEEKRICRKGVRVHITIRCAYNYKVSGYEGMFCVDQTIS